MPPATPVSRPWQALLGVLVVGAVGCAAWLACGQRLQADGSEDEAGAGGEASPAPTPPRLFLAANEPLALEPRTASQVRANGPLLLDPVPEPAPQAEEEQAPPPDSDAEPEPRSPHPSPPPQGGRGIGDPEPEAEPEVEHEAEPEAEREAEPAADFDPEKLGPLDLITLIPNPPRVHPDLVEWHRRLEAGGAISAGNSDERDAHLRARVERSSPLTRLQWNLGGNYGESNRRRSTNNWFSRETLDYHLDPHWILFFNNAMEYDEFENLALRASLAGGLGYRFFDEPDRRLIVRVGPGVTFNLYHHPVERETVPDMLGEVELRWPVWDWAFLDHSLRVHPGIEEIDNVRLSSDTSLEVPFTGNWSWSVGLRHEYNNRPAEGRLRSDYVGYVGIVYED